MIGHPYQYLLDDLFRLSFILRADFKLRQHKGGHQVLCTRETGLFADEVHQETVFTKDVIFHSCRKVLRDLGPEYNNFQLLSLNSASKGFYGE